MNKIFYHLFILLIATGFIFLAFGFINLKNEPSNIVPFSNLKLYNHLNLSKHLSNIKNSSANDIFPFHLYLSSDNYKDINQINRDLEIVDSLYPAHVNVNRDIMTIALTDSLQQMKYGDISKIDLDSVSYLMQYITGFMYYSMLSSVNQNLYASIYDYWMNFVSNYLTTYSESNKNAKFNNKFIYLVNQCEEGKYNVAIKIKSIEKVVYNLTNNYYGHLVNASWNQSSNLERLVFTLLILSTFYSYIYLILGLIKKNKKIS